MTDDARLADAACAAAIALHERVRQDLGPTLAAAAAMRDALAAGRKVLVFGNGGSASDAQHFAAELVGRFQRERRAMAAVALTTDTSILTALANDYSFEVVFTRQVEALGQPGDVALGITTSGGSPNVIAALRTARAQQMRTIALTGRDGGGAGAAADIHVNVPAQSTARVQEVHRTLMHIMCELIENGASSR
ncbi:MAG TPA: SIS domain-containing protein [Vicinamibacterales bacterium]|nr:SIS domain-containing protein [Vicinamibacterales bacterium]